MGFAVGASSVYDFLTAGRARGNVEWCLGLWKPVGVQE